LANASTYGVIANGSNIYVGTASGLSISTDGGTNWITRTTANGLGVDVIRGVYASGNNVYAATNSAGLSISTDGGASFVTKTTSNGLPTNNLLGVYASGSNVYAATNSGVSISTDGGATWTNRLPSTTVYSVFANGSTIYAGTLSGLQISTDAGATWTNYTTANGLANNTVRGVYAVGSKIYAATSGGGVSIGTSSSPAAVPEPTSMAILALGALGVAYRKRRKLLK
jgi:hypothetical protein